MDDLHDLCAQFGILPHTGTVGGIHANTTYLASFIADNLQLQTNVIDGARRHGVTKLHFLGSSCIYPRLAPQQMPETCLLSGPLEPRRPRTVLR